MPDAANVKDVLKRIEKDDVANLAMELSNIDSPTGREMAAGEFALQWLAREGFSPRKIALDDRGPFNVMGMLPGTGKGTSLLFNSHLDTVLAQEDVWLDPDCGNPIHHSSWRDGDRVYGMGIVNDKGPMACWMVAAKAIKDSGVRLPGDLILTMVCGEIAFEPVDEFQGLPTKDRGSRFAVSHGAVADYALVAEGTSFGATWVEAGKAFCKVTVRGGGTSYYTPHYPPRTTHAESPNAIVHMARLIPAIEDWAKTYEVRHQYECPAGTVIPKVNIGAIRGGIPTKIIRCPQQCAVYLDVRITPIQHPLDVKRELEDVIAAAGVNATVELFAYRQGIEGKGIEPLVDAIGIAHEAEFGAKLGRPAPPHCSMWRDVNVFNELKIPAVTYGPAASAGGGNYSMLAEDLYRAARIYAATALDLCSRPVSPASERRAAAR
jgi:acetylornithine deacetylase/succinyl-diaminopimelate desuccinylase-like protein